MTYRLCVRCDGRIPFSSRYFEVVRRQRNEVLLSTVLCGKCAADGIDHVKHPIGWMQTQPNKLRHEAMVMLRNEKGWLLKEIGLAFGLDHSSVSHHLKGECRCMG